MYLDYPILDVLHKILSLSLMVLVQFHIPCALSVDLALRQRLSNALVHVPPIWQKSLKWLLILEYVSWSSPSRTVFGIQRIINTFLLL